jgi:hypothetical protein
MLMSALRLERLEAMMALTLGASARSLGRAVRPSMTGISMSRMMTSTVCLGSLFSACWPSPTDATTTMSSSTSRILRIRPRVTAESSTNMTRIGSSEAPRADSGGASQVVTAKARSASGYSNPTCKNLA